MLNCNIYMAYCTDYILSESEVKLKNTIFVDKCCNAVNYYMGEYSYLIFSHPLPIIVIHSAGHALQNKTDLIS